MTVTIYDPFAYGPGEAGPFNGTQTDVVATLTVEKIAAAARGFAYYLGLMPRDIITERLKTAHTQEGVAIPAGAHLLTLRDRDRRPGVSPFAVAAETPRPEETPPP